MATIDMALLVVALICFLLGAAKLTEKVDLKALGLAAWVLSLII